MSQPVWLWVLAWAEAVRCCPRCAALFSSGATDPVHRLLFSARMLQTCTVRLSRLCVPAFHMQNQMCGVVC